MEDQILNSRLAAAHSRIETLRLELQGERRDHEAASLQVRLANRRIAQLEKLADVLSLEIDRLNKQINEMQGR